jgi:small-conductance mechanosensitive channel
MDLSNVLIGLGILIPSLLFLTGILRLCGRRHNFRLQLFFLVFFSVSIIGSFYYIFGQAVALYLVSGLGLGIGFALRPIFSKILSGAIFDATHVMESEEVILNKDIKGKIVQVGLLHTWLYNEAQGSLFMIGNKYLEDNPVKLSLTKDQLQSLKLKSSFSSSGQKTPFVETGLKFV